MNEKAYLPVVEMVRIFIVVRYYLSEMRKSLRIAALTVFVLGVSQESRSQNRLDSVINYVFESVALQEGNVFLDSVYLKADTSHLRKYFAESLKEELAFVRTFKLALKDWTPKYFQPMIGRVRTRERFFEEHKVISAIPLGKDSTAFVNFEKWDLAVQQRTSRVDSLDIYNMVGSLANRSSWKTRLSNQASNAAPKLFQILAVYESNEYYLIIYQLMLLQGYPHYYPRGELLFK